MRHKHCLWVGHIAIAIINPAEGGEGSSLARTAVTTDTAVKARMSEATMTSIVTDESCARAAADNDETDAPD